MRWLNTVPSLRVQTLTTCTRKPAVVYANHIESGVSKQKGLNPDPSGASRLPSKALKLRIFADWEGGRNAAYVVVSFTPRL